MKPKTFMLIAGEASGDLLAAELVAALRAEMAKEEAIPTSDYQPLQTSLEPRFFGAGGPRMAAAGVELAFDMTEHSVIGLDALKAYPHFRRLFRRLYRLALDREPDVIICVDFAGFNRRFAHAIKRYARTHQDWFHVWNPKLVQYVSPQVWASREGRAYQIAKDYDLLLSIFPFEKDWYAKRVPELRVEFVGNPLVERYGSRSRRCEEAGVGESERFRPPHVGGYGETAPSKRAADIVLLPGSRRGELRRHVPLVIEVAKRIRAAQAARFCMVVPSEPLRDFAKELGLESEGIELRVGGLDEVLKEADLAITKSGTITMECACFGVPAVVFYKTWAVTYFFGRRVVKVTHLAMPNLLAKEEVFPEFVQDTATPENITKAALEILHDEPRRQRVKAKLAEVIGSLGEAGASRRAAESILRLVPRLSVVEEKQTPAAQ
jgi:lipid-A-disaccharide synthase